MSTLNLEVFRALGALGTALGTELPAAGNERLKDGTIAATQQTIRSAATAARAHADQDLKSHLRSLINHADSSDVEFVCTDGVRVRASRILLIGRSAVLNSMLTNGMLETTSSVINLPGICSASLLSVLEFLYTGDVLHYAPKDWTAGLGILSAAHFLYLQGIDSVVQDFLMSEIVAVASNFQGLAIMLTIGLTFKNLSNDDMILLQLVSLLEGNWMEGEVVSCLSEEALDFILQHTKPTQTGEDRLKISLAEYFRFRGIMLWSVCHGLSDDCEKKANDLGKKSASQSWTANTLDTSPPEEMTTVVNGSVIQRVIQAKGVSSITSAVRFVDGALPLTMEGCFSGGSVESSNMDKMGRSKLKQTEAQEEVIKFWDSHQASKEAAARVVVHIDWLQMPVTLFVKHVEPLKLIPDSVLVDIFRFHSFHRPMPVMLHWLHGLAHSVLCNGFVIQKFIGSHGSAMCRLANSLMENLCVWRFTVEEFGSDVQLGFVCGEGLDGASRAWNVHKNCLAAVGGPSGLLYMTRVLHWTPPIYGVRTTFFKRGEVGTSAVVEPYIVTPTFQRVEFRYHRDRRTCHVTVDGKEYGMIWSGLSGKSVFPVVSLGETNKGRVRLDIVSGFDVLQPSK